MSDVPSPPPPPGPPPTAPPPPAPALSDHDPRAAKPPRPDVRLGGWLAVGGSVIAIVGTFLTWLSVNGTAYNGYDTYATVSGFDLNYVENPGYFVWIGALTVVGLGIALIAAGRVLAVAIIGVVMSSLGVLFGIFFWAMVANADLVGDRPDLSALEAAGDGSVGVGLALPLIGAGIALAGTIMALAKRRRWPEGDVPVLS
jgi:hypothetical protein